MTIMRKIAFIAVSISAFIYLVLQTDQGQLWLSKTQQSLLGAATKQTRLGSSNAPKQDELIDSFTQFLNNSKQATQISELEIQLKHMQTDIVKMTAAMQQLTALKNTSPEQKKMLGNAQIQTLQDNDTSVNVFAAPPKFQATSTTLAVHDKQQNALVVKTPASSKSRKADARMRQLEHQARLQEVVQRMELTALQAISR